MEPVILRLPERHVGQALSVLVMAFGDDPVLTFFLDNSSRRTIAYFGLNGFSGKKNKDKDKGGARTR